MLDRCLVAALVVAGGQPRAWILVRQSRPHAVLRHHDPDVIEVRSAGIPFPLTVEHPAPCRTRRGGELSDDNRSVGPEIVMLFGLAKRTAQQIEKVSLFYADVGSIQNTAPSSTVSAPSGCSLQASKGMPIELSEPLSLPSVMPTDSHESYSHSALMA